MRYDAPIPTCDKDSEYAGGFAFKQLIEMSDLVQPKHRLNAPGTITLNVNEYCYVEWDTGHNNARAHLIIDGGVPNEQCSNVRVVVHGSDVGYPYLEAIPKDDDFAWYNRLRFLLSPLAMDRQLYKHVSTINPARLKRTFLESPTSRAGHPYVSAISRLDDMAMYYDFFKWVEQQVLAGTDTYGCKQRSVKSDTIVTNNLSRIYRYLGAGPARWCDSSPDSYTELLMVTLEEVVAMNSSVGKGRLLKHVRRLTDLSEATIEDYEDILEKSKCHIEAKWLTEIQTFK